MQFHNWVTHYQLTCQQLGRKIDHAAYLQHYKTWKHPTVTNNRSFEEYIVLSEALWQRDGKPYYNILPSIMPAVERMKLNIPINYLEVPAEFSTCCIRFPITFQLIRSILVIRESFEDGMISFIINNPQGMHFFSFDTNSEKTIDILLANVDLEIKNKSGTTSREVIETAIRYYSLVHFLRNYPNEELIRFDVLNRLKERYDSGSPEQRRQIEDKSKRNGKNGWNIGVNEVIHQDIGSDLYLSDRKQSEQSGRELSSAHIRTGHIHCVRCGTGKKDVKVMWYRPTVVRPDLPFVESK